MVLYALHEVLERVNEVGKMWILCVNLFEDNEKLLERIPACRWL